MAEELLSSGFRKSMQSMKPPDGNPSSNIMMSLISSVSIRRLRISPALLENTSAAVLSAAYVVEHLSDIMLLILSNPIFCSNLVSMFFNFYILVYYCSPIDSVRRSLSSLMFWIDVTCPAFTNDIFPVSSETTTTSASLSSVIPIAALCLIP